MSSIVPISSNPKPYSDVSIVPTSPTQNSKIIKPESQSEARRLEQENLATFGAIDQRKKEADLQISAVIQAASNPDVRRPELKEMIKNAVIFREGLNERKRMKENPNLNFQLMLISDLIPQELQSRQDIYRSGSDKMSQGYEPTQNSTSSMSLKDYEEKIIPKLEINTPEDLADLLKKIGNQFAEEIKNNLKTQTDEDLIKGYIMTTALRYTNSNPNANPKMESHITGLIDEAAENLAEVLVNLRYQLKAK